MFNKKLSGGARRKLNAEKSKKEQEVLDKILKLENFFMHTRVSETENSDDAKKLLFNFYHTYSCS